MASKVIDEARLTVHRDGEPGNGDYVLYWMQASVRTRDNHALEYAVQTANDAGLPLVVAFGLDAGYTDATPRTFRFLAEGLVDVAGALAGRNIGFVVRAGPPYQVAHELSADAAAVVLDRAYLREPRVWRTRLADAVEVPVIEVESNVVVPVEVASDKREWAARTIRPKLHEHLDRFLTELRTTPVDRKRPPNLPTLDAEDRAALLSAIEVEHEPAGRFRGGEHQAQAALRRFVADGLGGYAAAGKAVEGDLSSHLSMFLHYGHISPAAVVRAVRSADAPSDAVDAFVEEVVVRRELAHNFVWHEPDYDSYAALPEWARTTLAEHRDDERPHVYTAAELENAATDDPYWNAAMVELRETGYLHNRMRMYWGKRIIEWTNTPEYAYRVAIDLNNRLFLDGRDPNSYANVGWVFGLHDQAFAEREVIGKVRPMTQAGLERKIDAEGYVRYVEDLTGIDVR